MSKFAFLILLMSILNSQNTDIAAHLKLPPVKLHCSMLAEDAIVAAIKDYKSKQIDAVAA